MPCAGCPDAQRTIGINLHDKWLIAAATTSLPRTPDGAIMPYRAVTTPITTTSIVFAVAYLIEPLFKDLWRIAGGAGALVVAEAVDASPTAEVPLYRSEKPWSALLRRLTGKWDGTRQSKPWRASMYVP